jgi:hypothetical protein
MLAWVVTFRPIFRRSSLLASPKSLPVNSFADPHPLTPVASILYEKQGGRGVCFSGIPDVSRSDLLSCPRATSFPFKPPRTHLRSGRSISPFLSITCALFSSRRRVYPHLDAPALGCCGRSTCFPQSHCGTRTLVPQSKTALISLRSGETTPLSPVSKDTRADIGNYSISLPVTDSDSIGVASRA